MQNEYLVLKWSDIEEHLNDEELENFYDCIAHITNDTPEEHFTVVSSQEPCADRVQELVQEKKPVLTKKEAMETLQELSELKHDPEVAHIEADEVLIRLINDKEVEKAFDEVPKWYA